MGELAGIPLPGGGSMPAWVVRPAREPSGAPSGAVLLLHEIFGLNRNMRALADWIAALGHVAVVPDVWWHEGPGIDLEPDAGSAAWSQAMALLRGLDEARAVAELRVAMAFARGLPGCNGRVGTVGFCLGGRLAMRLAAAGEGDCHVSYYGVGIEAMLGELGRAEAPVMLHLAERDPYVPPTAQAAILAALGGRAGLEVVVHPGADHAFARAGARSFDLRTATVAHARTAALLEACLSAGDRRSRRPG